MKHLSLLFVLVCLLAGASRAATVSGTISYSGSSGPVVGKKVYLADSSLTSGLTTLDSAVTGSTGGYSITVPTSYTSGRLLVYTMACGYVSRTSGSTYSGGSLTLNLALGCSLGTVSGIIAYGGWSPPVGTRVYIVDSALSGTILHRDSTLTNASGAYSFSVPLSITSGLMHTYTNACGTSWLSGFYSYTGISITSANIYVSCSSVTITDSVVNSTTRLPVASQKVYLLDSSATIYIKDSAITDASGRAFFSLSFGVPAGTMKVYTYACGWQTQTFSYAGASMTAPTLAVCLSTPVISGTLTNATTSTVVPYWPVTLVDSSGGSIIYYDSMTTNSSGGFSFIVPSSITSGRMVVSAFGCGNRVTNGSTFSAGSNLTLNLSMCATSTATIGGTLLNASTSLPLSGQKVYFLDSVSSTLVFRDSVVTNSSGNYVFTIPAATPSATLKLSTISCGSMASNYYYYSGSSVTVPNWGVTSVNYTFSGTVYHRTGTPVAGVDVFVTQLGSSPAPTVNAAGANAVTAANGTYTLSLPCSWTPGMIAIEYGTPIAYCSSGWYSFPWSGGSASGRVDTFNCRQVSGVVSKQGGGAAANAKVYMIKVQTDTSTTPFTTSLIASDSTTTNAAGQYQFNSSSALSYYSGAPYTYSALLVKAALQPSDPAYSNFLPTYHDSSLVWSGADTVTMHQWMYLATSIDISLRSGSNPGGPGFIGGNVLLGANKTAGVGDPLSGRILLLTTAAGQAVAYTYSDTSGKFSFSSLPLGNYLLFGDAGGKLNPPLAISLSAGQTSINNVVFEENSQRFEGHLNPLGVTGHSAIEAVRLYPSPAKSRLNFSGLNSIKGDKSVVVRDLRGAVMLRTKLYNTSLEVSNLPSGVYLLQLQSDDAIANFRFIKE